VRRFFSVFLALVVTVSLSGCIGTMITSPTAATRPHVTTRIHLLYAPNQIDAHICKNGLSETFTHIPVWGMVLAWFTFGLVTPVTTSYACIPDAG